MLKKDLLDLSKETLTDIIWMLGKNWVSVDGFWYMNVEDEFGPEAALRLDIKNWQQQSKLEGHRLKEVFRLEGGMDDVLKALDLFHLFHGYADFEIEEKTPNRSVFIFRQCPIQEARVRMGRGEFDCKVPAHTCYAGVAAAVDPTVELNCLYAPPDEHPADIWCRWEVTI